VRAGGPVHSGCMSSGDETDQQGSRGLPDDQFQRSAEIADALARTAETGARIHDDLAERWPDAAEHAARERLLARAEREAAEAFRNREMPSEAVREAIRASGSSAAAEAYAKQRTIDAEQRDSGLE
jgi:hypothetical protein